MGLVPQTRFAGQAAPLLGRARHQAVYLRKRGTDALMAKACALVPLLPFAGQARICGTEAPFSAGQGKNSGTRRPICGSSQRDKNESAGQTRGTSTNLRDKPRCLRATGLRQGQETATSSSLPKSVRNLRRRLAPAELPQPTPSPCARRTEPPCPATQGSCVTVRQTIHFALSCRAFGPSKQGA